MAITFAMDGDHLMQRRSDACPWPTSRQACADGEL